MPYLLLCSNRKLFSVTDIYKIKCKTGLYRLLLPQWEHFKLKNITYFIYTSVLEEFSYDDVLNITYVPW